jgi:hypothetical protein
MTRKLADSHNSLSPQSAADNAFLYDKHGKIILKTLFCKRSINLFAEIGWLVSVPNWQNQTNKFNINCEQNIGGHSAVAKGLPSFSNVFKV